MGNTFKRTLALALGLAATIALPCCDYPNNTEDSPMSSETETSPFNAYEGEYSPVNGTYGGVDDLGRVICDDISTVKVRDDRYVGIFTFCGRASMEQAALTITQR